MGSKDSSPQHTTNTGNLGTLLSLDGQTTTTTTSSFYTTFARMDTPSPYSIPLSPPQVGLLSLLLQFYFQHRRLSQTRALLSTLRHKILLHPVTANLPHFVAMPLNYLLKSPFTQLPSLQFSLHCAGVEEKTPQSVCVYAANVCQPVAHKGTA